MKVRKISLLIFAIIAQTILLLNNALATNPCGLPTAGGVITCDGDGNPTNDQANMPNGLIYNSEGLTLNVTTGVNSVANSGLNAGGIFLSNSTLSTTADMNLNSYSPSVSITGGLNAVGIGIRNVGLGNSTLYSNSNLAVDGTANYGIFSSITNSNNNSNLSLTNNGDITLTGDYSYALYSDHSGTGSLTVVNEGDINVLGNNSSAITIGIYNTDNNSNSSIANYGAINVIGDYSNGIEFYSGANSTSTITSNGVITLAQDNISGIFSDFTNGIKATVDNGTVNINVNADILALGDAGSAGVYTDLYSGATANINVAANTTISSPKFNGIVMFGDNTTNNVVNVDGFVIGGDSINRYGIRLSGNSIVNIGATGSVSSLSKRAIRVLGSGNAVINNSGIIDGVISSFNGSIDQINLKSASTTIGAISLDDMDDSINIYNNANISGVTSFDGGSGTDNMTFDNFSTSSDIFSKITNFENFYANNKSQIAILNNLDLSGKSLTNNNSRVNIANGATLSVDNYTQNANATLQTSVLSNSDYGKVAASGTATFDANSIINVDVLSNNSLQDGQTLSGVISAGTLSTSSFRITDNSNVFKFNYVVNGNNVDLVATDVTKSMANSIKQTSSNISSSVVSALTEMMTNNNSVASQDLSNALSNLTTPAEITKALEQLSPPNVTNQVANVGATTNTVANIVNDRVSTTQGFNSGDELLSAKAIWIKPFKSWGRQYYRDNNSGYSSDVDGIALGFDGELSKENIIGLAFAFSHSEVESSSEAKQKVLANSYQLKFYGSHSFDDSLLLSAQTGFGYSRYDSAREISFSGFNKVATANYDGWNSQIDLNLEKKFPLSKKSSFIPFVKANYSYVEVDGYKERGADGANYEMSSVSDDSLIAGSGFRFIYMLNKNIASSFNTGISYDFKADRSVLTSNFEGSQSKFSTSGVKPDPLTYDIGLGLNYNVSDSIKVSANYNLSAKDKYQEHSGSMSFRFSF